MTFSIEQALEAFFNNSGGGGIAYGGTTVSARPITNGATTSSGTTSTGGGETATTEDGSLQLEVIRTKNGTYYMDEHGDVWQANDEGQLTCLTNPDAGLQEWVDANGTTHTVSPIYMLNPGPWPGPVEEPSYEDWSPPPAPWEQWSQEPCNWPLDVWTLPPPESAWGAHHQMWEHDMSCPDVIYYQDGSAHKAITIVNTGEYNLFITTTFGTLNNDTMAGAGLLLGYSGDDALNGSTDADWLNGGSGNDWLDGGAGSDLMDGGEGWDVASYMSATGGVTVDLTSNANSGAASGDKILNMEVLQGSNFADMLTGLDRGGGSGVQLYGEGGDDGLTGKAGGDALFGGAGNDWLDGGPGGDILDGGAGWDVLSYQSASSGVVVDLTSNANGGAATGDVISNIEVLQGSNSDDTLIGIDNGGGNGVQLYGEGGNDTLLGKGGGDSLFGGAGNDTLDSGFGSDVLNGGAGADTFRFSSSLGAGNVDTVQDFSVAEGDRIVLGSAVFMDVGTGALSSAYFNLGAATSFDHHILYDQGTGELFYDIDGSGGVAAIKFAAVSAGTALSAANFFVV
jgi:Ca2+-binding RTX toxin-like protein